MQGERVRHERTHQGFKRGPMGAVPVYSDNDQRVHDPVALDEIELYGEMIIAAASSDGPLSMHEIDAILGVGCL